MSKRPRKTARRAKDDRPLNPKDPTFPLARRLSDDAEPRTRELIFALRRYLHLARNQQWPDVVRELIELGQAAVPELVAELDRSDDIEHLETLGCILCQINDPRSLPALIRVIARPRRRRQRHHGGMTRQADAKIDKFLGSDEWWHSPRLAKPGICGGPRPPEIIQAAIERISGHDSPSHTGSVRMGWLDEDGNFQDLPSLNGDLLRLGWVGVRGDFMDLPNDPDFVRQLFGERQRYWEDWWKEHGREFLPEDELHRWNAPPVVEPTPEDHLDKVEQAGIARLGALFPTGPEAKLGPVQEVKFVRYNGTPFAVDFDRGRGLMEHEGQARGESWEKWMSRLGLDQRVDGAQLGLHSWKIDNSRWETIDQELLDPRPLKLEMEDCCFNDRGYRDTETLEKNSLTWLFVTREGGSGILQVGPQHPEYREQTWRYRMWIKDIQPPEIPLPQRETSEAHAELRWSEAIEVTMRTAKPGANCLWSFQQEDHVIPWPDLFQDEDWNNYHGSRTDRRSFYDAVHQDYSPQFPGVPEELMNQLSAVDMVCLHRKVEAYDQDAGKFYDTGRLSPNLLIYNLPADRERLLKGFSPDCFQNITPQEALAHRDRMYYDEEQNEPGHHSSYPLTFLDEPTTALFRKQGLLVLLQIDEFDPDGDVIHFRYKLTKLAP